MNLQGQEELGHAMKFRGYLRDPCGRVAVLQLSQTGGDSKSSLAAFKASLPQE